MGLLDDAIREHLELKRRRGADATEISRQESDALGPVRRSPDGVPDMSDVPPLDGPNMAAAPDAPAAASAWEQDATVHTPPAAAYEPPPVPAAPAAPPPAVSYEPPPVPAAADEPAVAEDEPQGEEPGGHSLLSRLNPVGRMRHAPREHDDEPPADHEPDIVPADDEPEGEELLEETPEFLEETPEHDRLWFEQRPPRDFNFDD
jgi:hypothetical protein